MDRWLDEDRQVDTETKKYIDVCVLSVLCVSSVLCVCCMLCVCMLSVVCLCVCVVCTYMCFLAVSTEGPSSRVVFISHKLGWPERGQTQ